MKIEMSLDEAQWLAGDLIVRMQPYCERVAVAGSIRREKEIVGDIEIVCVPKCEYSLGLFDLTGPLVSNELFDYQDWCQEIRWIKPGTSVVTDWPRKMDGKYWRGLIFNKFPLDLFLVEASNWGIQYLVRTGSREFSERVVTALRYQKQTPMQGGYLRKGLATDAEIVPTLEERDVFDLLGWDFIEPKERV